MSRDVHFGPPRWLKNAHLQTLWASLVKHHPVPPLHWHRLELPDSDFVDLCSTPETAGPVVLVLHGLEGSVRSSYARAILSKLHQRGFNAVLMHFRGCSGAPNRLPRRYHFGDTGDLPEVIEFIKARYPNRKIFIVGYSLGGNVALKWLGEQGTDADALSKVRAAVAVSVPFSLHDAAQRLNSGFSRLYQWHLLGKLKKNLVRKRQLVEELVDVKAGLSSGTFYQYDDLITAPLHGFKNVNDYYNKASSLLYLRRIEIPTLILHAKDDPFMWPSTLPKLSDLSSSIQLRIEAHGGHVGFIASQHSLLRNDWLETEIVGYLEQFL